ncbi:hypothetical protein IW140_002829 [Coemansia sp. RSA 1813]|nr:hypothetical protein EV178_002749 [Coemansia sp. RSA 1646]KAJ2089854.1 hypothetical protein IW138_003148 [Coemansia sp. RSA 986]KAJ2214761.1 hypothetical protein EV179_002709 [Coemansia sp. RSA 487]KAJ2569748.1 hypothetical protein IW140_002829 [Coemansia sp. RSA 1813]
MRRSKTNDALGQSDNESTSCDSDNGQQGQQREDGSQAIGKDQMSEKRKRSSLADRATGDNSDQNHGCTEKPHHISAQEEADLSSALIAKLLAEESGGGSGNGQYSSSYYNDYGNGAYYGDAADDYMSQSEGDDDWDPNRKKRRTSKGSKARRRQQNSALSHEGGGSEGSDSDSSTNTSQRKSGRARKVKKAGQKKEKQPPLPVAPGQYRSGAYTDEEEDMFCKGLELFGRSWSEISEYVGTRDSKSIRSHAQKYFIKLFRDSIPLPAKVLESGEGYTLSGRPLDPNSAAARPYLQHTMQLEPPAAKAQKTQSAGDKQANTAIGDADCLNTGTGGEIENEDSQVQQINIPSEGLNNEAVDVHTAVDSTSNSAADVNKAGTAIYPEPIFQQQQQPAEDHGQEGAQVDRSVKDACNGGEKDAKQADSASEQSTVVPNSPIRTEYAMSRPQRNQTRAVALRYNDPHQMVRCTPFPGQPLSSAPGCQPFRVIAHTNAQVQMDFHAHLMLSEVIGLLGGVWDAKNKVVTVVRAFPCTALETDDAHTNVEMDPGSQLVVKHQIMDAGLCVVGWYHSHPTFRPDPSVIDIENQTAYQKLFRDNDSTEEPFVGAIVGPYDAQLPGPVSALNWFYVGRSAVDRGHPKRLMVETKPDNALSFEEREILLGLLDTANSLKHHAALEEAWRPSSTELRLLKMIVSLTHRMPWLVEFKAPLAGPDVPSVDTASGLQPSDNAQKPAPAKSEQPTAPDSACADSCSDLTMQGSDDGQDVGDGNSDCAQVEKCIPHKQILAGQRTVRDPLIEALCSRFSAGLFKAGPDGKIADLKALERVLAAYFTQWADAC